MTQLLFVDLYELLGVPEDASTKEIRSAYRAKIRTIHPDRPGSTEDDLAAVKTLNAARELLCDPLRRCNYDLKRRLHQMARPSTALARITVAPSPPPPPAAAPADDPSPSPPTASPPTQSSKGDLLLATSIAAAGVLGLGALLLTRVRPGKARC